MKNRYENLIDFKKVDPLLEGFNKSTGFVTAILDLDGRVLSKSGWRQMCTEFHRVHPETSKKCTISDTKLAGKMAEGENYHFYKCLNGLVDVAVPIVINGEHIANLFSGQFFFEKPNKVFFRKQAEKYGFDEEKYMKALEKVPVVSKEKVQTAMDFLLNMTQLISETMFQKMEQTELNVALKKSEEKFKSVFESANVGKSITLPTGKIQVNEAFCKMLGYTREELQDTKWQDLTPQDEIPTVEKILAPLLEGKKESTRFEKRYIHKNGTHIWTDVNTSILHDDKGKPFYFITTVTDITEQTLAKEVIKENEEKFQSSFHTNPAAQAILSMDGKFVESNDAFSKLTGYRKEQIIGKSVVDLGLLSIEEQKKLAAHADASGGIVRNAEVKFTVHDGSHRYILYSTEQIILNGTPHRLSIGIDITERKRAEQERQKFFMLANSSSEFIGMCDLDLKPIYLNPAGMHMVGLPDMDAACQLMVQDYFFPEDQKFIEEEFFPRVLQEGHGDVEIRLRHFQTGEPIWMYYYLFHVRDDNDELIGWATVSRNITEQKQAEELIREKDIQFRKLSSNMSDLVFQFTRKPDGSYFVPFASEGIKNIFGCSPEDVREDFSSIKSAILAEDLERVISEIEYSAKHLTNFNSEFRVHLPDKDIQWTYSKSTPEKLADGSISWYGFVANISERKQAEEELKKAQEIAHIGNWRLDFATNKVVWSEELYKIYGFDPKLPPPLLNESNTMFTKESWELLSNSIAETGESGIPYEIELEIIRKDGSQGWMWARGEAIFDNADKIVGLWGAVQDITYRKEARIALKKSEEKYKLLFDLLPDSLIVTRNGLIETVNNAALELFGLERKPEIIDTDPMQWVEKESFETVKNRLNILYEKSTRMPISEYGIIQKNGEIRQIDDHSASMKDEKGIFSLALLRDITQRKNTEKALQKSNERIRAIFEEAPLGIALIDSQTGHILEVNAKYAEIVGRKRQEMLSLDWMKITHPDDVKKDLDKMALLIAGDVDGFEMEKRYIHTNGSIVWVNLTVKNVSFSDGTKPTHLAIVENITERRLAEIALRESEEKFRNLMEGMPLPICFVDKEGDITFRNNQFNKFFGYSEIEIPNLEAWWKNAYPDKEYRKWVIENWESAVKNAAALDSEIKSEEYKVTCKDGTTCDIIISGFTMGENFLATFIDITERKLSESELLKHREHLEELVNERTKELATKNEELERMNKLFVGRELRMVELKEKIKELEDEKDA